MDAAPARRGAVPRCGGRRDRRQGRLSERPGAGRLHRGRRRPRTRRTTRIGATFTGRAWSEPTLLRLAYAFEQATQARRLPRAFRRSGEHLDQPSRAIRPVSTVSWGWCCGDRCAELGQDLAVGLGLDLRIGDAVVAISDPGGAAIAMVDRDDLLRWCSSTEVGEVVPKRRPPSLEFRARRPRSRRRQSRTGCICRRGRVFHVIIDRRHHARIDAGHSIAS